MRHTLTFTALTTGLLISTAAFAANVGVSAKAAVEGLPEQGTVSLSGTVDRVIDGDTFVLRDAEGETIDVHTAANVKVNKGDVVSVTGEKSSEMAGLGEEIENARVSVTAATDKTAAAATLEDSAKEATGVASQYESGNTPMKTTVYGTGEQMETMPSSNPNAVEEAISSAKRAGDKTAAGAAGVATGAATAEAVTNDSIANLPREGVVELNGIVSTVDNEQSFTLRDASGKTIDIHTASNVEVQPGDTVSVNGNVKSKLLGLGREIESAKVLVVSAAE